MERDPGPRSVLASDSLAALAAVGPVDLVAGLHVSSPARLGIEELDAVAGGLGKLASTRRAAVLVACAGTPGTVSDALGAWSGAAGPGPLRHCLELAGPVGRGQAILGLLVAARELGAAGLALVDADLGPVPPGWLEALLDPIDRGEADYVSPVYSRAVWEGTLTTNLLAPFTRAVYGKRLQQPAGGCAAMSKRLLAEGLEHGMHDERWTVHGMELWLATEALVSGGAIMEAHLGRKPTATGVAQPDLATTLVQTVGPLFALAERHHTTWQDIRGSAPVPLRGDAPTADAAIGAAPGDRMVRAFKLGLKDLLPVWEQILADTTLGRLYALGLLAPDEFQFPPTLWARAVSDFAVAYHERRLPRDHLLRALTPLYLGRVAAFLLEAQAAPPARLPELIDTIGQAFEAEKEHLAARWR